MAIVHGDAVDKFYKKDFGIKAIKAETRCNR